MEYIFASVIPLLVYTVVLGFTLHAIFSKRKIRHGCNSSPSVNETTVARKLTMREPPPGPLSIPIFGSLHHTMGYDNPFECFTVLAEKYGPVYSFKMGSTPALVVSSVEAIKEVLIKKGNDFDSRPKLIRWDLYFGGNQNNSLAMGDYSSTHKAKRQLCSLFTAVRQGSHNFDNLNKVVSVEVDKILSIIENSGPTPVDIKTIVSTSALNMFTNYMCSTDFEYDDDDFKNVVTSFNAMFDDVNQVHPLDFFPWLIPFYKSYFNRIKDHTARIRKWVLKNIICDRIQTLKSKEDINDLADSLLYNFRHQEEVESLSYDAVLSALEDVLGGSAVIGNMILRLMYYLATNQDVMVHIQTEIERNIGNSRLPEVLDRKSMPYSEAFILESLRMTANPIIPHLANKDSSIGGFEVKKDTVVLLNNFKSFFSSQHWVKPYSFLPTRFLKEGKLNKPPHFLPFSTGKRHCIAENLVLNVLFVVVSSIMQKFDITLPKDRIFNIKIGSSAIKPHDVIFTKRQ